MNKETVPLSQPKKTSLIPDLISNIWQNSQAKHNIFNSGPTNALLSSSIQPTSVKIRLKEVLVYVLYVTESYEINLNIRMKEALSTTLLVFQLPAKSTYKNEKISKEKEKPIVTT